MINDRIAHAKAYPFTIPQNSYILTADGERPFSGAPHHPGRHPVIASGSNASPERLMAKYTDHPDLLHDAIPVERAQLHDFDAVYSAHIAGYGAIPATLSHAPGTIADVFITWLTDPQLEHMHQTEAVGVNYDYVKLTGILLLCSCGAGLTTAYAYVSRRGCLNKNAKPVPLAAISATGRQWPAMTEAEALDFTRSRFAPEQEINTFIRQHIESDETRAERTQHLSADALPLGWSSVSVVR